MASCQCEISTDQAYKPLSREKSVIFGRKVNLNSIVKFLCLMTSGYHLQEDSLDILGH